MVMIQHYISPLFILHWHPVKENYLLCYKKEAVLNNTIICNDHNYWCKDSDMLLSILLSQFLSHGQLYIGISQKKYQACQNIVAKERTQESITMAEIQPTLT
jgi:hypothetical protein